MTPAFEPGDRLWVDRRAYSVDVPRVGETVVLEDPESPGRWLVKRVAAAPGEPVPGRATPGDPTVVPPGHVFVLSDNPALGRDSRRFGPVPLSRLLGRVWYRYAPPPRRGPVTP
jgi:signal peptidase I